MATKRKTNRDKKKLAQRKVELLNKWHGKARCHRTQEKALSYWKELEGFLTEEESFQLKDTWLHVDCGHSPKTHLDKACLEVKLKWENILV